MQRWTVIEQTTHGRALDLRRRAVAAKFEQFSFFLQLLQDTAAGFVNGGDRIFNRVATSAAGTPSSAVRQGLPVWDATRKRTRNVACSSSSWSYCSSS